MKLRWLDLWFALAAFAASMWASWAFTGWNPRNYDPPQQEIHVYGVE